ncbi:MAG TPA: flagellar basal body P-ring formation protein FlgA [Planctomycetes bacterium]|nr:flagellar basal body P-ring formation protein FlgA [Planctomycetota bacterium]
MKLLALLLFALPFAGPDDPKGEVTITLGMEASVRGTEVELGEIAHITGSDSDVVRSVEALSLGYAPAPGYSRLFRTDVIERALRRRFPEVTPHFRGQVAIRIFPKVETIQPESVLEAARTALVGAVQTIDASFTPVNHIDPVKVPEGTERHTLRARLDGRLDASGSISVPVDVLVDGVRYRTVWTTWDIQAYETRPVLRRPVRAGERLEPGLFERRRVRKLRGEKPGLAPNLLLGAVALRDLAPGETVTEIDVQRPVVVVLGESVFLRVRKGPIEARVAAVALESGAVGDRIRVRTQDAAKELVATIESRDLCSIDLGQ